MIARMQIIESQARKAIAEGEFGDDIRLASPNVAVVLTQGWCPQWADLNRTLTTLESDGLEIELSVFELVYDLEPYSAEFMSFKEKVFGNYQIPYVRYYQDGRLTDESNWVSRKNLLKRFDRS